MNSRIALASRLDARRLALAGLVLGAAALLAVRPSLQSVRVVAGDGVASVVLSADGALPVPKVGVLADPPRIYLDFPDVATATDGTRVDGDVLVRGVRVGVNQVRPLVTRVVIDLARPVAHRIDAGARDAGQFTIIVGVPVAAGGALTPPAEPPKAIAPTTAVRAPAKDVAEYLQRVSSLLDRLERLRPLLVSLDAAAVLSEEQLKAAGEEFGSVRQALAAVVPPRSLAATHELFRDVCVLGAASASARVATAVSDDSTRAWNAAAAAAGALVLLDRARADVGLTARRPERASEAEPVIAPASCERHATRTCP